MSSNGSDSGKVRLDRWLWAARFFKTRAQAKSAIEGGKVHINQQGDSSRQNRPKVSKEIAIGDMLTIRRGDLPETVLVKGLAEKRGSAKVAATLFEETPQSIEAREAERARRGTSGSAGTQQQTIQKRPPRAAQTQAGRGRGLARVHKNARDRGQIVNGY